MIEAIRVEKLQLAIVEKMLRAFFSYIFTFLKRVCRPTFLRKLYMFLFLTFLCLELCVVVDASTSELVRCWAIIRSQEITFSQKKKTFKFRLDI